MSRSRRCCCGISCDNGSLANCLNGKCLDFTVSGFSNAVLCTDCTDLNGSYRLGSFLNLGEFCCFTRRLFDGSYDIVDGTCPAGIGVWLTGFVSDFRPTGDVVVEVGMDIYYSTDGGVSCIHDFFVWALTGDDAAEAISQLCQGQEVELPLRLHQGGTGYGCNPFLNWNIGSCGAGSEAINPVYTVCEHDESSVTVRLTSDCDDPPDPPDPPPDCDDFLCDEGDMGTMSATMFGFEDRTGVVEPGGGYDRIINWYWSVLNGIYGLVTGDGTGVCVPKGGGTSRAFYVMLGVEDDYSDPGYLIREDTLTGDPTKNIEYYVYKIIVVVTCEEGYTYIESIHLGIQLFTDMFGGSWPPASATDQICVDAPFYDPDDEPGLSSVPADPCTTDFMGTNVCMDISFFSEDPESAEDPPVDCGTIYAIVGPAA